MEQVKTLKQYCKEAKQRLKSGFWKDYSNKVIVETEKAENSGISVSKVKEYIKDKVSKEIQKKDTEDAFYTRVKEILVKEGEISNAIGRLTDREYYETLSYEEKQRYLLELSEKYLKAVERFNKEKSLGIISSTV